MRIAVIPLCFQIARVFFAKSKQSGSCSFFKQDFFGLTLLLSFSLGLATVLVAGGIMVVVAKNKALKKFDRITDFEPYLSLISAFIVTLFGLILLLSLKF